MFGFLKKVWNAVSPMAPSLISGAASLYGGREARAFA